MTSRSSDLSWLLPLTVELRRSSGATEMRDAAGNGRGPSSSRAMEKSRQLWAPHPVVIDDNDDVDIARKGLLTNGDAS